MKILRYESAAGIPEHGVLHENGSVTHLSGDIFSNFADSGEIVEIGKRLAPLRPVAILAIGLNYRQHAEETGTPISPFPVLFVKSPGSLQNPGDPIFLPRHLRSDQVDFECELAIVIGKTGKNIAREDAFSHVLGYTCANDVSARDWQKQWGGGQFCRGKSFDTFCPLGPVLVTRDEIPEPNALRIRTFLNGQTMQDSTTADMIFDVPRLIEFLSGSTTLEAGTIILTGTPSGVGAARKPPVWLKEGDEVTIEIEKIGRLSNPVLAEA